jgi:hypothetical protein
MAFLGAEQLVEPTSHHYPARTSGGKMKFITLNVLTEAMNCVGIWFNHDGGVKTP